MIKAYVFDAYGTLFDVHSAVRRHQVRIGAQAERLSDIWRTKQLEYSWVLTLAGAYKNFEKLTAQSLDFAMEKCGIIDGALRSDLLTAYDRVEAYPEIGTSLKALKNNGAQLAILSNGTPRMLNTAIKSAGLDGLFDAVFSVDTIQHFKTDMRVYKMASEGLSLHPHEISFQSSNRWDIAGATQYGFRTVWINRTNQPDEYAKLPPQFVLPDLTKLASL